MNRDDAASPGAKRPDLDTRQIALEWLGGLSQLDLSIKYDCSTRTIIARLAKARAEFPDLPWEGRQVIPGSTASGGSGVRGYLLMKDGKPGESPIPRGSIVNGGSLRGR